MIYAPGRLMGVADLLKLAAAQAERQAACSALSTSGRTRRRSRETAIALTPDPDQHPLAINVDPLREDDFR